MDQSNNVEELMNIESFPDIYEKIFSYLDVKSLCNASLVCHNWNDFIGNSSVIMQRVSLEVNMTNESPKSKDSIEDVIDILKKSNRNFRSIKIKNFIHYNDKIVNFMEKHHWVSIVLDSQFTQLPDIDSAFLKELTTLEIKTLELSHVIDLLKASTNLKHLKIIVKFCKRSEWSIVNVDHSLQLESLEISLSDHLAYRDRNIKDFLKTQNNLNQLDLNGIILDGDTMEIITKMPKLKSLVIREMFYDFREQDLKLEEMQNLETLKFLERSTHLHRIFSALINFSPNLKFLSVNDLNQSLIDRAGTCLSNLLELQTTKLYFNDISNSDLFPNLERVKVRKPILLRLQRAIADQVASEMTNFSICLYEEITQLPHKNIQEDTIDSLANYLQQISL